MKKRRLFCLSFLVCGLILIVVLPGMVIWRAWRQEQLNQALLAAVQENQSDQVDALLRQGADADTHPHPRPTFRELVDELLHRRSRPAPVGPSALQMAASAQATYSNRIAFVPLSYEQTIHALLRHGARANVADAAGRTPLMLCAWCGMVKEVEDLMKHGADFNAMDEAGMQALEYATWAHSLGVVQILVLCGASINHQDASGNHALLWAADGNRLDILYFLVLHGADVKAANTAGTSALMLMVRSGNTAGVKLLLEHGADPVARDHMGRDCLFWLRKKPQSPLRQMLLQAAKK
jgi:ankyrin repeat protein